MRLLLFAALAAPLLVSAQQSYRSPYLADPSLIAGYADSCAAFWTKVYDTQYGGYYTNVNRMGGNTNTAKHTMNQSRDAYGFIRAYQMTGKQIYLTQARQALQFMYAHSWDTTYGGWYNTLDRFGNAAAKTENKTAFYQHYALLGIAAMFEATRDSLDLHWLMKGYANNEARFWDARPGYSGYYDLVKYDGTAPSGKSFNATVDAITTHILHLYLLTQDDRYLKRLKELAENMKVRLQGSMATQAIGFVEQFDSDWGVNASETMTIMGHVLKTSWCFARLYHITRDSSYLAAAEQLEQHVLDRGYDAQYGGPYKDYNRTTGQMLMWGITDTAKAWWQMEQAVTAGLILFQITGKQQYLTMADETLDFFMKYFVDHTYGEVYSDRARNGNAIPAWGTTKGNDGKAGYHSIETGYYAYLYQSLMVAKSTASLFYYFAPVAVPRTIALRPLSFPDYRIRNAYLNDTLLTSVDQNNSTITLGPGRGGAVRVTFEYAPSTTLVADKRETPGLFSLSQNYPNPFNPATVIEYTVEGARGQGLGTSNVRLAVYDLLGREVAVVVNEVKPAGRYEFHFEASGLASGVYVYRLTAGEYAASKKMVLAR
jgi:mannose/cellobiose epimerase-like protein (N-acyl-D-glucosamine 2-epimerase family)